MNYFKNEKKLDVSQCEFESVEDLNALIKSSIAHRIGVKTLMVTPSQESIASQTNYTLEVVES